MASDRSRTRYSEIIKGDRYNFDWAVRFDLTGGYLGITQFEGEAVKDRTLLSPKQVAELLAFIDGKKASRAA